LRLIIAPLPCARFAMFVASVAVFVSMFRG
jgi:hypothetical protein